MCTTPLTFLAAAEAYTVGFALSFSIPIAQSDACVLLHGTVGGDAGGSRTATAKIDNYVGGSRHAEPQFGFHASPSHLHFAPTCLNMPPPPIPQRKEVIPEVKNEGSNPPPIPVRSPRRRPAGAVATAMVSGQGNSGQGSLPSHVSSQNEEEEAEDQEHANNPYDLKAMPGSSVTASYPFHGDDNLQQLSFAVSETRRVCRRAG